MELQVFFNEEDCRIVGNVDVSDVGPTSFRIEDCCPFVESATYGDVVELEKQPDGSYEFVRVVERGEFDIFESVVAEEIATSAALETVFAEVKSRGGYTERYFGGCLFFALPPKSDYNPLEQLDRLWFGTD
jgi:hypothetical protein